MKVRLEIPVKIVFDSHSQDYRMVENYDLNRMLVRIVYETVGTGEILLVLEIQK